MLGSWLVLFLVTSVTADTTVYGKLGGEVDLKPVGVSVTDKTSIIIWKDGPNIAVEWDRSSYVANRHFKGRSFLNNITGVLTIKGLVQNDSMTYTPEIDHKEGTSVHLKVISSVPVPTIVKSNPERKEFTLTCDGDTTGAEPVSYTWKADNNVLQNFSEKDYIVTETSSEVKVFSCEMKNPVSQESSKPFPNPLTPELRLKIFTGVTVFVCSLSAVLLLAICHRIKAGAWFFEKPSMPWEGEFWRKGDRQQVDTTESNGTTTPQLKGDPDEEAPTAKN